MLSTNLSFAWWRDIICIFEKVIYIVLIGYYLSLYGAPFVVTLNESVHLSSTVYNDIKVKIWQVVVVRGAGTHSKMYHNLNCR